jgi:hypothetical protein
MDMLEAGRFERSRIIMGTEIFWIPAIMVFLFIAAPIIGWIGGKLDNRKMSSWEKDYRTGSGSVVSRAVHDTFSDKPRAVSRTNRIREIQDEGHTISRRIKELEFKKDNCIPKNGFSSWTQEMTSLQVRFEMLVQEYALISGDSESTCRFILRTN